MKKSLLFFLLLLPFVTVAQVKTDTIQVYSPAMKKNLKAAVTTPSSYQLGYEKYPVVYLLHGGSGAFSDWHQKVTEPGMVERLAEEYNLIIVTPGVGPSSYYFDSPMLDSVMYETYITAELIPHIDQPSERWLKRNPAQSPAFPWVDMVRSCCQPSIRNCLSQQAV